MKSMIKWLLSLSKPKVKGGLNPAQAKKDSEDKRNLILGAVQGQINIKDVPNETFYIGDENKKLFDQIKSDMCTGFGIALAQTVQEGVRMHPEFQYMLGALVRGNWQQWGNGFHNALKGAVKYGGLEQALSNFNLNNKSRNFLANWNKWPKELFDEAKEHEKDSYFQIKGRYDTFDDIRAALWQNRKYKRLAIVGCMWRPEWVAKGNGIIDTTNNPNNGTGHLFCIDAQVMFGTEPYLRSANSYGDRIGDDGYHYWSKKAINNYFIWGGGYMLVDIERSLAEILNQFAGKLIAVKSDESPKIYLIKDGKKHHIKSENIMNALGYELKEGVGYTIIPEVDIEKIPEGKELTIADLSNPMIQLFSRNKIIK